MKEKKSHAMIRAMERYAVDLTESDLEDICEDIVSKKFKYSQFLLKQRNERSVYLVNYADHEFVIIFSDHAEVIVTFLHKKWIQKNEDGSYKVIFKTNKKTKKTKQKKNEKTKANGSGRSKKKNRNFKYNKMQQEIEDLEY